MTMITRMIAVLCLACSASGGPEKYGAEHAQLTPAEVLASLLLSADQSAAFNPANLAGSRPASSMRSPMRSPMRIPITASRPATLMSDEAPAEAPPAKTKITDLKEGAEFMGKVSAVAVYGLFVDFGAETDGLLHVSEISADRLPPGELEKMFSEGDDVKVTVKQIDAEGQKVSLATPDKIKSSILQFEDLEIGMEMEGTVKSTISFGAFVDIGAVADGLLHVSELGTGEFVDDASKVVSPGDKFKCFIKSLNPDKNQIGLGNKEKKSAGPRGGGGGGGRGIAKEALQKYADMDEQEYVVAKVRNIMDFGAFCTLEPGVDGLLHISQISEDRVDYVDDALSIGDEVQVRITNVDMKKKQIGLSMLEWKEAAEGGEESGGYNPDDFWTQAAEVRVPKDYDPAGEFFAMPIDSEGISPIAAAWARDDTALKAKALKKKALHVKNEKSVQFLTGNSRRRARIEPTERLSYVAPKEDETEEKKEEAKESEEEPVELVDA
mmetsp:Transcript_139696/g.246704  ORF Transcript_139696/g.246704 Transcript_139696/m.246704 type:complete len:495 (+) Transcript_139696:101-1585(+)